MRKRYIRKLRSYLGQLSWRLGKMECLLYFLVVVGVSSALPADDYFRSQNVTDMILEAGYPVQNFTVQTEDGYILDVIRIPGTPEQKQQFEENQREQGTLDVATGKPAVLLVHGLLSSAEDFVVGGPEQGLAFYLADQGYDVFLANARGNRYGRKHTVLDSTKDEAFWRFCWHEIGTKDLPAIIDKVLDIIGQDKVYYIGHMQGTTPFYVMASEKPEYNHKVRKMVSLGPVAFVGEATNGLIKTIEHNQESKTWLLQNLHKNEFKPSQDILIQAGQLKCKELQHPSQICENPYFLANGYGSKNYNMTTLKRYAPRLPSGASSFQVLHFAQLARSGRFEKLVLSRDQEREEYDLGKVTVPITIFYAPQDSISSDGDVRRLISKLPNVDEQERFDNLTNNMDFIYSENVRSLYARIVDALRN